MPAFQTPDPITAVLEIVQGDVQIRAGDGGNTVVTVEPTDPDNGEDRKAAEQTRVEYSAGRLLVKMAKLRSWLPRGGGGSVDVTVDLPTGSQLNVSGGLSDVRAEGALGEARIKLGMGRVNIASAEALTVKSGTGDVIVDRAAGHADIALASGEVRVRELDDSAVIKNSNGDAWVGEARGDLRVVSANGDIAVDLAHKTVTAKTANGAVRLGEVVSGAVVLESHLGDLEVGIREGTAAYLDVKATAGRVRNELEAAAAPESADERVQVRARTTVGDVVIRHA